MTLEDYGLCYANVSDFTRVAIQALGDDAVPVAYDAQEQELDV